MKLPSRESPEQSGAEPINQERGLVGALPLEDPAQQLLRFIRRRGWLVIAFTLAGLASGIGANVILPRLYTANARIEVEEDKAGQFRLEPTASAAGGISSATLETEIEILRSRTLAIEVIHSLRLDNNPNFIAFPDGRPWDMSRPAVRNTLIQSFLSRLKIQRFGHTNIIDISVTSAKPEMATLIANTLIDGYIEHNFRENFTSTEKIAGWLDQQLSGLKENLQKSEARMLELQKDIGVFGTQSTESIIVANLEELNKELASAQVDRLVKEARYRTIKSSTVEVVAALAGESAPVLQQQKMRLSDSRAEYAALIQTYGPAYPRVKELKAQIDQAETALKSEEDAQIYRAEKELEAAQSNEKMLRAALDVQEQQAYGNGQKAIQYELARHQYEANRLLYDGLQERLQEAGIIAGLHSSSVHIIDNADIPIGPSQPRVRLNEGLGLGVGLFLGLATAFVLEALDTNLRTMGEIEHGLQLPLIGAIPAVPSRDLLPSVFREQAITKGAASWSRIAEALRGLRTSILLSSPGSPPKVLMITSSRPAEGKTSLACLSAITLALNGSRTILIDADLRRPSIHARFKISKLVGLSSVLSGNAGLREAVLTWDELPSLHIMPSGPASPLPSELLGSKRMEELVADLRAEYDFLVFDTPPVLTVTDAAMLSRLADATILILRYGEVQRQVVSRSVDLLDRAGAHLLGVAVNVVNFESPEYAEYYGKKHYEYYEERKPD